jgi:hypothetical protein
MCASAKMYWFGFSLTNIRQFLSIAISFTNPEKTSIKMNNKINNEINDEIKQAVNYP